MLAFEALLLRGAWQAWDLRLYDGSFYFRQAGDLARSLRLPAWESSPLYCAYYAVFRRAFVDPFTAYFAHRIAMLTAIGGLAYLALGRLTSPALGVLGSACLLLWIPEGNLIDFAVRPFVLIPVLLATLCALSSSRLAPLGILVAFFTAAGSRTEFGICVPLYTLGRLLPAALRARSPARPWRPRGTLLVGVALSAFVASHSSGGARAWLAFVQHYAPGYAERHPEVAFDPHREPLVAVQESFGAAASLQAALRANPGAFGRHVIWNLRRLPSVLERSLRPRFPLGDRLDALIARIPSVPLLAPLLAAGLLLARRDGGSLAAFVRQRAELLWVLGLATLPALLGAVLIRPRSAYLYTVAWAVLCLGLGVLHGMARRFCRGRRSATIATALASLAVLAICPAPYRSPRPRLVAPTLDALPPIPGAEPYGLIGPFAESFCNYTDPERCRPLDVLSPPQPPQDVEAFLQLTNTRIVLIAPGFVERLDPAWRRYLRRLIAEPERTGFARLAPRSGEATPIDVYARLAPE